MAGECHKTEGKCRRGCFFRGFGGFTKIILIFAISEGGDRVTVVGYFLMLD
jgi:hypothetical protein